MRQGPQSTLTFGCDALAAQPKTSAQVHLVSGDVLAVTLCENGTTGFAWEQPVLSGDVLHFDGISSATPTADAAVAGALSAAADAGAGSVTSVPASGPTEAPLGAASSTTFLFAANHTGSTTVTLSYSRPWAGGEKGIWQVTLDVTVD
jgi:predicted secreted protein